MNDNMPDLLVLLVLIGLIAFIGMAVWLLVPILLGAAFVARRSWVKRQHENRW
jgi:uncharacterized membrane protein